MKIHGSECGGKRQRHDALFGVPFARQSGASRREVLQWLAMAGASSLFPASTLLAQSSVAAGRIDVHHHVVPDFYVKAMEKEIEATGHPLPKWSPAASVEAMDKNGVATSMLSPMTRVVQDSLTDKSERARKLARQNNEYQAQLVKEYPGRFGNFAALPLPDSDGSLREIEYAFETLKADGVAIWTSYRDQWPGDPAFAPVFEELNRRKAVVFIHPIGESLGSQVIEASKLIWTVGAPLEDTVCMLQFMQADFPNRFPDLKIVLPHLGGFAPFLTVRLDQQKNFFLSESASPFSVQARYFWYDTVNAYPSALHCTIETVGMDHLLMGTDYPFWRDDAFKLCVDYIGNSGLEQRDVERILGGNCQRLLGL
jgi:aminocarboxymuconate-semialdehyde decarboxylase